MSKQAFVQINAIKKTLDKYSRNLLPDKEKNVNFQVVNEFSRCYFVVRRMS